MGSFDLGTRNLSELRCRQVLAFDTGDESIARLGIPRQQLIVIVFKDTNLGGGKRWVEVSPPNSNGTNLLLAQTSNEEQKQSVGNKTGGRVFLFLQTNDFWRDYELMKTNGVVFNEEPRRVEEYGIVVVFQDLYGNKWDLLQLNRPNH